jgi:hypothetical protein
MKQQFKGPITLDIAARTVTLHDIQLTPDRVLLVVNATVGYIYHNFSIDDPAVITSPQDAALSGLDFNGLYLPLAGTTAGKAYYFTSIPDAIGSTDYTVQWDSTIAKWISRQEYGDASGGYSLFSNSATGNTQYPWQATWQANLGSLGVQPSPAPNVLEHFVGGDTVIHFSDYKDCDTHQNTDAISVFYEDGVDLGKLIKDESDETQTLLQTEFDETQTQLTAFQVEVKGESDETQTLLQTEFDETQTQLTAFQVEVKAESDATQTLLQTEFDQTQTQLTAFQAEVKAESDETQTLLQTEFDQTQTQLTAFQAEVKAESDETQTILNSRLAVLVDGKYPVLSLDTFSPANGYTVNITNGVYGPTVMEFVRTGVVGLRLFLTYDANGQVTSIAPV